MMARRRRYGTKIAPIEISDSDNDTSFLDGAISVIDLTDDGRPTSTAQQYIRQQLPHPKAPLERSASIATTLSDDETASGSFRSSTPIHRESSKRSSSGLPRSRRKFKSYHGTPHNSQDSTETSPFDHSLLGVERPLFQQTQSILRETFTASRFPTPRKDCGYLEILPAQRTPKARPLPKNNRLSADNSPLQHKYFHSEDQSLHKLHHQSPVGPTNISSRFWRNPQLPGGMGTVLSLTSNAWDHSMVNTLRDPHTVNKHGGRALRETSPRVALAIAQSVSSEKWECVGSSTSISLSNTEEILREEKVFMQNEHSKSVRNHLCNALIGRNKCSEKLPKFYDNEDVFADMERILEDNEPTHKTKHKQQANRWITKAIAVIIPHDNSNQRVPAYKHYIPVKQNILVPDTRYLAFDPYLGDVDGDEAIESRNKWLEDYRKKFEINKDDKDKEAIWLNEYVPRMLERLGLCQNDVMSFLKDSKPANCTNVLGKTKEIEVFITAFKNVFDMEIQDVMPGMVEPVKASKLAQNWQEAPNRSQHAKQLLEAYLAECPICHMFACGIHGDYESNDESDRESDSGTSGDQDDFFNDSTNDDLDEHLNLDSDDGLDHTLKDGFGQFDKKEKQNNRSFQPRFVDLNKTLEGMLAQWDRAVSETPACLENKTQRDNKPCSSHCFLNIECNQVGFLDWKDEDLQIMKILLRGIEHDFRASCILAPVFGQHCYLVQKFIPFFVAWRKYSQRTIQQEPRAHSAKAKQKYWYNSTSKMIRKKVDLDKVTRVHYPMKCHQPMGCNHVGLLCTEAGDMCDCLMNKIPCDKFCVCNEDCFMKFKGCDCSRTHHACSIDKSKCACQMLNRECDPDLCHSCGAAEAANPFTRSGKPSANGCFNTDIQRGVEKRLLVGESSHPNDIGFGAYLAEPVTEDEFIAEYVGEVISAEEADLRWQLYEKLGLSYIFDLNGEMCVDSYRYGNKTRFINHGRKRANCYPKVKLVNGEHRIAFYAKKSLAAGVELFFNYGRQFIESHGLRDEESGDDADDEDNVNVPPPSPDLPPIFPEYDTDEYEEERPAKRAKT